MTVTDTLAAPPAPDVWSFSPKEAASQLAAMKLAFDGPPPTATPSTPREARQRLDALGRDVEWQQRHANGELAAKDEFVALTTMAASDKDPVAGLLRGEIPPNETRVGPGYATLREMASVVPGLREDGLTDEQISELLNDKEFSPQEVEAVRKLQIELHGTPTWVAKLLSGDAGARREQLLMSMVLLQLRAA
jgi:hypothetical protein